MFTITFILKISKISIIARNLKEDVSTKVCQDIRNRKLVMCINLNAKSVE